MRWWAAMGLLLAGSLACGGGGSSPQPDPVPVPEPDPEPIPAVKDKVTKLLVPQGPEQRSVWLHVPAGASKDNPLPLVVAFHGGNGDGRRIAEWFAPWFDKGVILAFPNFRREGEEPGRGKKGKSPAERGWARDLNAVKDDIAFAEALVDQIRRSVGVDEKRVFATGFAQGAAMTWHLACRSAKVFQGFAPVADTLPRPLSQDCPVEGGPRPLMLVAGTEDKVALWSGRAEAVSVTDSVGLWLVKNGCDKSSERVEDLPDTVKDDASTVKRHTWTCSGPPVQLLEVKGGGHGWPRSDARTPETNRDLDATAEIMRFFGVDPLKQPEG